MSEVVHPTRTGYSGSEVMVGNHYVFRYPFVGSNFMAEYNSRHGDTCLVLAPLDEQHMDPDRPCMFRVRFLDGFIGEVWATELDEADVTYFENDMASENIGYHTRLADGDKKVVGGFFGGRIDQETVERLTRLFEVEVGQGGTPYFIDSRKRKVRLYLSVDPGKTEKGKAALAKYREELRAREIAEVERVERLRKEIDDLMRALDHEEILRRLKGA